LIQGCLICHCIWLGFKLLQLLATFDQALPHQQKFLARVKSHGSGSKFCCSDRVGSAIFGMGLENFPKKSQIFNFFPFRSKKFLCRIQKYPGQRWVGLLFTAGSKVCSGQGPSLLSKIDFRWCTLIKNYKKILLPGPIRAPLTKFPLMIWPDFSWTIQGP